MVLLCMAFGIYVHIPHCLQLCPYCDFATVKHTSTADVGAYTEIVVEEIRTRNRLVQDRVVSTLYFGGGTPSLAGPKHIAAVIQELSRHFDLSQIQEITLEINPGTINSAQIEEYRKIGVNRYSVGVQTFNETLLKLIGREHSPSDTHKTLRLLKDENVHFTADLLFALPRQTISNLEQDLKEFASYQPEHVSAYILTLPENNPLNDERPDDKMQSEMFYLVEERLKTVGLKRYEISNFSIEGKNSCHNSLYWTDQPYWGLGMSAHSYLKLGEYGTRFWNPPTIASYKDQVQKLSASKNFIDDLPKSQREILTLSQALTDFSHTRLRTMVGLNLDWLARKFGKPARNIAAERLTRMQDKGLVISADGIVFQLSRKAYVLSEMVFQEMTFLMSELN